MNLNNQNSLICLIELGEADKITLGSHGADSEGYSFPYPTIGDY